MKTQIPFAYQVAPMPVRMGRRVDARPCFRRASLTVDLPEVPKADLPLAFSCRVAARSDFALHDVDYRLHRGRLVRAMRDMGGARLTQARILAIFAGHPPPFDRNSVFWAENLFMVGADSPLDWKDAARSPLESEEDRERFAEERRVRVDEIVHLAESCVLVEDVLYRPASEPVWGVNVFGGTVFASLCVDHDLFRPPLALKVDDDSLERFAHAIHARTGQPLKLTSVEERVRIVRFDHLRAGSGELLVSGIFPWSEGVLEPFVPSMSGAARSAFAEVVRLSRAPWDATLQSALAAFAAIPGIVADVARSKPASRRLRQAETLGHVVLAACDALEIHPQPVLG